VAGASGPAPQAQPQRLAMMPRTQSAPQRPQPTPQQPAAMRRGAKPGRNAPCPCGSGIKYKKCCAPAFG